MMKFESQALYSTFYKPEAKEEEISNLMGQLSQRNPKDQKIDYERELLESQRLLSR